MKTHQLLNEIEHYLNAHFTQDTAQTYHYIIKRFLNRYPHAAKLQLADIEAHFAELKQKNGSVGYRKVNLAAIKTLYDVLLNLNRIKHHPCKAFLIVEKRPTGKNFGALLSLEELELLLTLKTERYPVLASRNKAMIGLLIYQGITSKELVKLKTHHINVDEGSVRVIGQGKNKSRTLSLKPRQIVPLINYLERDRTKLLKSRTDTLFIGMRGTPLTTDALHEFVHRLSGAFDKPVSPMQIRNSVISHWVNERQMPLEDVQIMAGHCYPSTTEQYINPSTEEQRAVVNQLHEQIFSS